MIVKLYRKYISENIRNKIYAAFLGMTLLHLRTFRENLKAKYAYLFRHFLPDTEQNRLYAFMGKHGLMFFPYPFALEYKKMKGHCS
jgi:hypothetical protein